MKAASWGGGWGRDEFNFRLGFIRVLLGMGSGNWNWNAGMESVRYGSFSEGKRKD